MRLADYGIRGEMSKLSLVGLHEIDTLYVRANCDFMRGYNDSSGTSITELLFRSVLNSAELALPTRQSCCQRPYKPSEPKSSP